MTYTRNQIKLDDFEMEAFSLSLNIFFNTLSNLTTNDSFEILRMSWFRTWSWLLDLIKNWRRYWGIKRRLSFQNRLVSPRSRMCGSSSPWSRTCGRASPWSRTCGRASPWSRRCGRASPWSKTCGRASPWSKTGRTSSWQAGELSYFVKSQLQNIQK